MVGITRSKVLFCFLEVFATFGQTPKKILEKKTRENQKNQTPQTMWGQGVAICFFLEGFAIFGEKQKIQKH